MFKKIAAIVALYWFACAAPAAPMLYTLSGTVTDVFDDAGIVLDTFGTTDIIGRNVEYVVLIDPAADATYTYNNGVVEILDDFPPSLGLGYSVDNFFADLVSGSLIEQKDGGSLNEPDDAAELNQGSSFDEGDPNFPDFSSLLLDSDDDVTQFFTEGLFEDWVINQSFFGSEIAYGPNYMSSEIVSDLVLTDISSAVSPVPVPAAVWLFGSALLGLFGFRNLSGSKNTAQNNRV